MEKVYLIILSEDERSLHQVPACYLTQMSESEIIELALNSLPSDMANLEDWVGYSAEWDEEQASWIYPNELTRYGKFKVAVEVLNRLKVFEVFEEDNDDSLMTRMEELNVNVEA